MLNAEKFRDEIFDNNNNLICDKLRNVYFRETNENQFRSLGKVTRWLLSEYKEPILDEVEREYLSKVCEPFEVYAVEKRGMGGKGNQAIVIVIENCQTGYFEYINLPCFNANTMYKGMELGKRYKPKELGVCCKNNPKGKIKHG